MSNQCMTEQRPYLPSASLLNVGLVLSRILEKHANLRTIIWGRAGETANLKGELQRQNKLISSERPFEVLQNETKIVKIRQAVLEISNFKDLDLDSFPRKND